MLPIHPDLVFMRILMKEVSRHWIFCNPPFLLSTYLEPFHVAIIYILNHLSILNSSYKFCILCLIACLFFCSAITNLVQWVSLHFCSFGWALGLFLILFCYHHAALNSMCLWGCVCMSLEDRFFKVKAELKGRCICSFKTYCQIELCKGCANFHLYWQCVNHSVVL